MLKVIPCSIRETLSSRIRQERGTIATVLKVQGLSRSTLILNVVCVSISQRAPYLLDTDGGNIVRSAGTRIPETRQKAGRPVTQCLEYLTTQSLAHSFTSFCAVLAPRQRVMFQGTPVHAQSANPDSASGEFLLTGIIRFVDYNLRSQIEIMIFYSQIYTVLIVMAGNNVTQTVFKISR